ncbi:dynamin family protein [Paeniglutamicibacter cryotolerans]|uniref:Energy-coupling factor transporter ATP-binding protein EcfA2 n=1 Tax=Paeniglutamicibacter cryotolerans TaxID=670079 RepID=A0A839QRZ5_9MICC|nr:dynamin family protein [Paeniglutamicibacter cryotolerans]MBB2997445.1 energy-coupling factor transporter ATP-binding protein EcfA2 [Paeniglutamicibacter cryotolerans]
MTTAHGADPGATPETAPADQRALALLADVRASLARISLPLAVPGVAEARRAAAAALEQLDDYILPRYASLEAPLLAVVGGSTGSGKSTLVNALVGRPVTRAGAIRPTTRQPVLLHHPSDARWLTDGRILPSLARVTDPPQPGGAPLPADRVGANPDTGAIGSLILIADSEVPAGIALLDAPDIDSVSDENRRLANQLLAAADLWIFVTTANRYADAVPWKLLAEAARRRIMVSVVLDRIPAGVESEITADLRSMLRCEGLGEARIFAVAEAELDGLDMLPATSAIELKSWLDGLAADAGARRCVARQTLAGTVAGLAGTAAAISEALSGQEAARRDLARVVDAAFDVAGETIVAATTDGTLLRGEVLARWQDFVGTGEFFRSLETGIGRMRDRIGAFFSGKPKPAATVGEAIETGLHAVIVEANANACEEAARHWRSDPAGRRLLEAVDLAAPDEGFGPRAAAEIRAWQKDLMDVIAAEGADKRKHARMVSFGINGVAAALMIVVFASTAGLTGLEVGIAGGSAVVGQKLLEAIFGEDAVRRLSTRARQSLEERTQALLDTEAERFRKLLLPPPGAPTAADFDSYSGQLEKLSSGERA